MSARPDLTTEELETMNQIPRTVDQVQFTPGLSFDEIREMFKQSARDGGQTLSYAVRAKELLTCARTALDGQWGPQALESLNFIGTMLVIFEGTILLMEKSEEKVEGIAAARLELLDFARQQIEERDAELARLRSERPAVTPEMETLQLKLTGVLHAVGEMLVDEKHLRWQVTRLRSALENWGHHHDWCNVRKSPPEACNCGLAAELSVSSTEGKP